MERHKHRAPRAGSRLTRTIVNLGLIAWAGLLLAAIVFKPFEREPQIEAYEPASRPPVAEAAQTPGLVQRGEHRVPRSEPEEMRPRPEVAAAIAPRDADQPIAEPAPEQDEPVKSEAVSVDDSSISGISEAAINTESDAQEKVETDDADSIADIANLDTQSDSPANDSPGSVTRAQFTSGMRGHEPINRVAAVFSAHGQVFTLDGRPLPALYYFTEVKGMDGERVIHRWEYQGVTVEKAEFEVGGDRWRVYSKKALPPTAEGNWRVVVTDAQGNVLKTDGFIYQGS
jgi:hypothetical protein